MEVDEASDHGRGQRRAGLRLEQHILPLPVLQAHVSNYVTVPPLQVIVCQPDPLFSNSSQRRFSLSGVCPIPDSACSWNDLTLLESDARVWSGIAVHISAFFENCPTPRLRANFMHSFTNFCIILVHTNKLPGIEMRSCSFGATSRPDGS